MGSKLGGRGDLFFKKTISGSLRHDPKVNSYKIALNGVTRLCLLAVYENKDKKAAIDPQKVTGLAAVGGIAHRALTIFSGFSNFRVCTSPRTTAHPTSPLASLTNRTAGEADHASIINVVCTYGGRPLY